MEEEAPQNDAGKANRYDTQCTAMANWYLPVLGRNRGPDLILHLLSAETLSHRSLSTQPHRTVSADSP
jgi:hypothetical protein